MCVAVRGDVHYAQRSAGGWRIFDPTTLLLYMYDLPRHITTISFHYRSNVRHYIISLQANMRLNSKDYLIQSNWVVGGACANYYPAAAAPANCAAFDSQNCRNCSAGFNLTRGSCVVGPAILASTSNTGSPSVSSGCTPFPTLSSTVSEHACARAHAIFACACRRK